MCIMLPAVQKKSIGILNTQTPYTILCNERVCEEKSVNSDLL